ncbi:putative Swi5-like protein [Encephalitozoon intestinalis ATCC 50506]|uniref:Swi5-like protein n=1 Tax=Encephalitozoon intestinalis (strain ATCC 50506) TaxID=876142 RepID=E0S6L4_ENCIT|nr:putative Swi5-like protein [Encephalitozoon intestinalis ATCC 50506]ADM11349.1 putative Swi5-like protein [Encephalitozoon intestinalis ATCC 50506]UTX45038.1 DNA repair protein SWI5-like protein [Encephalitozoon intestinalis]
MKLLNDWEKEEIIHKSKIVNFDFLEKKDFISEVKDGFYYLSKDIKAVETELWKKANDELADHLDIKDIDKEIKRFIFLLNRYNEIKDIGQELIGRIASLRQTTARDIHEELGMETEL